MLIGPLPYQHPHQVVMVFEDQTAGGFPKATPSPAAYRDWRAMNRSFTDMAATGFAFANVTGDGPPELLLGRRVTANFFSVLGVRPVFGRTFTAADDASRAPVVVISHALWQRRYRSDPGMVGRTISMSGQNSASPPGDVAYEVVGVAPPSFVFLNRQIDYWVPMQFTPTQPAQRGSHFLDVVARLSPELRWRLRTRRCERSPGPWRTVSGHRARSRRRGRNDQRTGARDHQGAGDRPHVGRRGHRAHRVR